MIKHRSTGAVLWSGEADDVRGAVAKAVDARAYLARADLAGADLAGADLAGAYLAGAYLAGAYLADANLARADLARADLAGAYLAGADLAGAYLAGANLADARNVPSGVEEKDPPEPYKRLVGKETRLESARRYRETHPDVPVVEGLDGKMLERIDGGRLLDMGNWHNASGMKGCGTTHCRGGHAIDLAGPSGYELEARFGVKAAARMIYRASTGRSPHFFASQERALEDIRRCAEEEKT